MPKYWTVFDFMSFFGFWHFESELPTAYRFHYKYIVNFGFRRVFELPKIHHFQIWTVDVHCTFISIILIKIILITVDAYDWNQPAETNQWMVPKENGISTQNYGKLYPSVSIFRFLFAIILRAFVQMYKYFTFGLSIIIMCHRDTQLPSTK